MGHPPATSSFRRVSQSVDLPSLDQHILQLWEDQNCFARSIEMRPQDREYTFYDGPPFASGSPHYGNILAGIIKDIIPRYWTMRGFRVERRFGWDTHGLPVEREAEKQLGIAGPSQIEEYGVDRFNEACRELVEQTTEEWETVTRRIGRWVDFENDYKTMDTNFMESVWWVFKSLWDQGLVYQAFKVLPYSWAVATPISNFELNLGGHHPVEDPSITVALEVSQGTGPVQAGDYLLIWTTTPWTLPGNLGVGVGADLNYVAVRENDQRYWLAEDRLTSVWKEPPPTESRAKGQDLVGTLYQPAFHYFSDRASQGAFRVISTDSVTTEEGTGLVHLAAAYGEVDFTALREAGIDCLVDPIDTEGNFTDEIAPVTGMNIKKADPVLIDLLRSSGALFRNERITHSYPMCYRTNTPLMYKAIPTWFIAVEQIRDRIVENNRRIHWVPEYVGSRRFGNWLEDARDWAVSRNRFWGSCIPVWICDLCEKKECIGSRAELAERSGRNPEDLHKHILDTITWDCKCGQGQMRRVPEVLDCWFESGSMPYAQLHYPFENRERFAQVFPAQFIAEGLDQTRGWFYTLMVLGTALFDREPFENAVVNGMILDEDGQKMSKSLKNFPDPLQILDSYGADALRAALITSPALRAEPLKFREDLVKQMVRNVVLPLWNTYYFFTTYAYADRIRLEDLEQAPAVRDRMAIDRWIISLLQSLITTVNQKMEGYYLYEIIPPILGFVDQLTNWYVRRNRRRFWRRRGEDDVDKLAAFATLHEVLVTFCQVMAPLLPFITEAIYQGLAREPGLTTEVSSIHHTDYPEAQADHIDQALEREVETVREVVRLGLHLRKKQHVRVQQPIPRLSVASRLSRVRAAVLSHQYLIIEELNVKELQLLEDETELVELSVVANFSRLGPRFGAKVKEIAAALSTLESDQVMALHRGESVVILGEVIQPDEVDIRRSPLPDTEVEAGDEVSVGLDISLDEDLLAEGVLRHLASKINQLRRDMGLSVEDRIVLQWWSEHDHVRRAFNDHQLVLATEVLATSISEIVSAEGHQHQIDLDGHPTFLTITLSS